MKFACPACNTAGEIPDDNLDQPVTEGVCRNCGAPLLINSESGNVDVKTPSPKAASRSRKYDTRPSDRLPSVLSMSPKDKGPRDRVATGVFALILAVFIIAGTYFVMNIKRESIPRPFKAFSKLVEEFSRYSEALLGELQKDLRPQTKKVQRAQKHVRQGYEHYRKNRLSKARDELDRAIKINPNNPEAYFWRARTLMKIGQYDDAIIDLKKVVELNPRSDRAYDNLGWLYMRRNKFDESFLYLNKSIELKPDNGWAHYMRSRIYFKKGELQKALTEAETACNLGFKDGCKYYKRYKTKIPEKG